MISIHKSNNIPKILATKGIQATNLLCAQFDQSPEAFRPNARDTASEIPKVTFDSGIYGHSSVKAQLSAEQFGKCCYCEAPFTANGYGDVEHFRPKAAILPKGAEQLVYPGYYWLAYNWQNLLFSCQICNQQFKKNHFGLEKEENRIRSHHQANTLPTEVPLLVDPTNDDPEKAVTFKRENAIPVEGSLRGKYMIEHLGLQRSSLADARQARLEDVERALVWATIDPNNEQQLQGILEEIPLPRTQLIEMLKAAQLVKQGAALPDAPFAAMIRANFPQLRTG
jgi:uncharacterized protein (TIGR02646 family)